MRVAVATTDGKMINRHFGHSKSFTIFDVENDEVKFVETREVAPACSGDLEGGHTRARMTSLIELIRDCQAVLCSRIGPGAIQWLTAAGIEPVEAPGFVQDEVLSCARKKC